MAAAIDLNNIVFYNPRSEPQQPPRPPRPFRPFKPFKPGAQSQLSSISSPNHRVPPAFPTPRPPIAGCHAAANQQRPELTDPPSNDFDRWLRALEVVETGDLTRDDSLADQCFDIRLLDHQRPCLRGDGATECEIAIRQSEPMQGASDLLIPDSHASDRQISPMSAGRPANDKKPEREDNCRRSSDADSLPEQQEPPPPPVLVDRNGVAAPEWPVDGIINSRMVVGRRGRVRLEYLVDWRGYTPSWQPRRDLIPGCEELVDEFHKRYPNRPSPADLDGGRRPKRRGRPPSGHRRKRVCLGI
uniref:Chromo domain-containing protein n=1 Tax=Coccidioides posadasii RMSCC 3488 TaxID=454284 RepID=A0A0J6FEG6_COCPO|nr:hypothetical protein CPAG_05037 [Coccidioides posadasii RMSCC 3488]